jgi:hypothetical protein
MAKRMAPRVMGAITVRQIFVEMNEQPHENTQVITAANALCRFVMLK